MKNLTHSLTTLLLLTMLLSTAAYAIEITPQALTSQEVYFMDSSKNIISSYKNDYEYIYVRGEQNYISTVLADSTFEMLVDNKFAQPNLVSTNLDNLDMRYEYDSNFGDYCWHYFTSIFTYFPGTNKYLEVKTSTGYTGNHKAMVGTDYLIGDPWATSYLDVY